MEFFQFVQSIHKPLRPYLNQDEIIVELIDNIITQDAKNPFDDIKSTSSFIRYYNGSIGINKQAKRMVDKLDRTRFYNYIEDNIKEDDQAEGIKYNFSIYNINLDINNISDQLADMFYNIILEASKKTNKTPLSSMVKSNKKDNSLVDYNELVNININDINSTIIPNISKKLEMNDTIIKKKLEDLIPGITQDFIPEIRKMDKNYKYILVATNPDAYNKHKIKITYKFPPKQIEQINYKKLLNEANLTNKMVKVGNPISKLETIDGVSNPFPIFGEKEKIEETELYIGPEKNPPTIIVNLFLYNDYFNFKLNNVKLQLLVREENSIKFYNKRFENDWFDFEIVVTFNKENNIDNTRLNLTLKEKYLYDVDKYIEMFKYNILCSDKNATTKLSIYIDYNEEWRDLINNNVNVNLNLKEIEYNSILHEINVMKKLIAIQDIKKVKFKFNYDFLHNNISYIEGLCDFLIKGESKITGLTGWYITKNIEERDNVSIGNNYNYDNSLSEIELFDFRFKCNNAKIKINGEIIEKAIDNNNVIIKLKSNNVTIYTNKK